MEETGGVLAIQQSQPLSKGKEISKESGTRKGRRTPGTGRGKGKAQPISPKSTPKAIWIKRGGGDTEMEQKRAKKLKIAEVNEDGKTEEAEQGKHALTEAGDTTINMETGVEFQIHTTDKAEAGEAQLRQGE